VSAEDQSAAPDATGQNEPETTGTEQPTTDSKTLGTDLLQIAAEMGHDIGLEPPKAEAKPEPEAEPEPEVEEEPSETEEPETEEEVKPAAKGDKLVPLREVLEEREKKKRANARAEAAEQQAAQLQAQLQQVVSPQPTEDDPFKDINDFAALDRLEKSYEKAVDLADENPEGAEGVVVGRDNTGQPVRRDFEAAELVAMRKKAEKAIRKFIPERRTYLQQRAVADAEAAKLYPEFTDPSSEFTQAAAVLAQRLVSGEAAKDPTLLVWIGHAVRGWQMSQKEQNSNGAVKSPGAKKIVDAARQKVAPTATRTRSFVERGSGSGNVDKARDRLKQEGSAEAAEELVAKLLSGGGSSKRVEPIGE
jgi:hypothetical protein